MKIGSVFEDQNLEKRVSITPEIAKKYISMGIDVQITKNYGQHLGFTDTVFKDQGVVIVDDAKTLIETSDVITQMGLLDDEKLSILKPNQTYIGVLNLFSNADRLKIFQKKKNKFFFS